MRTTTPFNTAWRFHRGDAPGAEAPGFDDSGWRAVSLPHDWSVEGPRSDEWASGTGFLPAGVGWYRKAFPAPAGEGKAYVHFDGVYCNSEVWLNGHFLGKRPNGFASFRYDLTPHLKAGENVLAVRVDHSKFADSRWYTGSGINRTVWLITAGPVHVRQWGVFATTPVVFEERAEVQVEVAVENGMPAGAEVQVECLLLDPGGAPAAGETVSVRVPAGGEAVARCRLQVERPRLWSVEEPALYTLRTTISRDGQAADAEETRVGIRSIRFDPDEGFFLNGRSLKLKGVCIHDDAGVLGTAVPAKVWERRLRALKGAGVNAIRMSHNPHAPELYDLCDALGFLVQDEAFDEWELGKNKWIQGWNVGAPGKDGTHDHFAEWAETDLRDMILRDRNHPSVVMWSIGNEIDYPNDPYTHEVLDQGRNPQIYGRGYNPDLPHARRLGEIARWLVGIVKRYDTTRPVTAGLAAVSVSNEVGYADALDVVGYNYQEYRYPEDHARYPARVLYGSENGMAWGMWEAVASQPFVAGQFLWTGIDYLGEAGRWPSRGSGAGLLDLAGFPKPEYYFRKSIWTDEPMVYLGTRDVPQADRGGSLWSHKQAAPVWAGSEGEPVRVMCFTNCDRVELFLNGRSLGAKDLADAEEHVLFWDVPYEPGVLMARGTRDGLPAASAELRTAGAPVRIVATADAAALKAGGADLCHVEATVVDADGVPVYAADHEIAWSIEGPARLLGLESGDLSSLEEWGACRRRAFHGRLLGYVQAGEAAGPVTIRLSAPGLEGAVVEIRVVA